MTKFNHPKSEILMLRSQFAKGESKKSHSKIKRLLLEQNSNAKLFFSSSD